MKKQFILMLVILCLFLIVSCKRNVTDNETIKLGALAPLSGPLAYFGGEMKQGFDLAIEEINNKGGINGKQIKLVYEDEKCDPKETITALNKLKNFDEVIGFVGPFCGSSIQVSAEFSQANNLIGISPDTNFGRLSEKYFSIRGLLELEDKSLAEYAYGKLGLRNINVFYYNNYYGVQYKEGFKKHFEALGGNVALAEGFLPSELNDFKTQMLKLTQNADGLFIVFGAPGNILNQIKELDISIQVLGIEGVDNENTLNVAKESVEGLVFAETKVNVDDGFNNRFKEKYGEEALIWNANSYDSLMLLKYLFEECGNFETKCAAERMKSLRNYKGAGGTITFNAETWDTGKTYGIKVIKNGKAEWVN